MMQQIVRFTVLMAALVQVGCATLLSSDKERVRVRTNAPKAEITYRGDTCIAPCDIYVPRGDLGPVEVQAEGYDRYDRKLPQNLNWMILANIGFGGAGIFTALLDFINEKAWSTGTEDIYVTLKPSKKKAEKISTASRPTAEEFEKSIPSKPVTGELKQDLTDDFPAGWPSKWYYETSEFRYWTIVGEMKSNPTLAMQDSLAKAQKTIAMEFPKDHYKSTVRFETTHVEVKKQNQMYRGWRIIRVRNTDVAAQKNP